MKLINEAKEQLAKGEFSALELLVTGGALLLLGVLVGMIISPKCQIAIGSYNGSYNGNNNGDDNKMN